MIQTVSNVPDAREAGWRRWRSELSIGQNERIKELLFRNQNDQLAPAELDARVHGIDRDRIQRRLRPEPKEMDVSAGASALSITVVKSERASAYAPFTR